MTPTREPPCRGGRDHRNPWPASIGTGGRLRSESPADFVGMRSSWGARATARCRVLADDTRLPFDILAIKVQRITVPLGGPFPVRGDRSIPPRGGSPGVDSRRPLKQGWPRQGVSIGGANMEPSSRRNGVEDRVYQPEPIRTRSLVLNGHTYGKNTADNKERANIGRLRSFAVRQ
jgi:hypothetical protein